MTKPKATSLEEQVKTLQRHFGSMIVTMKDLKCSVDRLEKKVDEAENKEIKDIIEQQKVMEKVIEKVIAANAEAIKRLDEELIKKREGNVLKENRKDTNEMNERMKIMKRRRPKSADTSTEATVSTRVNADLSILKISVKNISKMINVGLKYALIGIQKGATG
jgi:phage shock protein A